MKNRLIALLLSLSLIAACGCGSKTESEQPESAVATEDVSGNNSGEADAVEFGSEALGYVYIPGDYTYHDNNGTLVYTEKNNGTKIIMKKYASAENLSNEILNKVNQTYSSESYTDCKTWEGDDGEAHIINCRAEIAGTGRKISTMFVIFNSGLVISAENLSDNYDVFSMKDYLVSSYPTGDFTALADSTESTDFTLTDDGHVAELDEESEKELLETMWVMALTMMCQEEVDAVTIEETGDTLNIPEGYKAYKVENENEEGEKSLFYAFTDPVVFSKLILVTYGEEEIDISSLLGIEEEENGTTTETTLIKNIELDNRKISLYCSTTTSQEEGLSYYVYYGIDDAGIIISIIPGLTAMAEENYVPMTPEEAESIILAVYGKTE